MNPSPEPFAALFKSRHFDHEIITLCVRWYETYKLSYRDLADMMAERGSAIQVRLSQDSCYSRPEP